MKIRPILLLTIVVFVASFASAQAATSPELESVLKKMDASAASFRSAQANFEWDRYEKVINEVDDIQFGTIYYRRVGDGIEMKANVNKPDAKTVLFSKGKIQVYQPKAGQVIEHDASKNREEVESYFVLGFGGSGQEMQKSFDVTYEGQETVNGVPTAKIHLVPKSAKVRNNISEITLWIDPQRGISVQQKFVEPQGDYRLAKYSDIKTNEKLNPDIFQIKTTGKTQVISK